MKKMLGLCLLTLGLSAWRFGSVTFSGRQPVSLSDGGVCTYLCTDGGYSVDGGANGDGGWTACGSSPLFTSDLFPANTLATLTCYIPQPSNPEENASVTLQLVGSDDTHGGLLQTYASTSQSCLALDGGGCQVSWSQGVPGLMPWTGVQATTNNTDGGDMVLCCPYAVQ